ncbi:MULTISPECIES: universal stress protein [unclassified Desulfovibrio]|uniref:universal stress protein n=1 Tax=unclassified Desulfovibrio TaxID=2593640 RepID=UPI002FD8C157
MTSASAPQKILLLLDEESPAAAEAVRIAHESGAALTALFVLDSTWNDYVGHDWLSGSGSRADFIDYMQQEEEKSEAGAFARLRELAGKDMEVRCLTASGNVIDQARQEMVQGYDLFVAANPLRRGLERIRGNVGALCENAPCRILLVPAE